MKLLSKQALSHLTESLWGIKARFSYLLIASIFLLFSFLGTREIWTQEHRWADIVLGMFYRHDFLHPYLGNHSYYDKPLLSYWLIALTAQIINTVNTWALRLPSAIAGLLAVWLIYRLGTKLKNRELGLLAGWMLITTYYFIFWARVSSADMLNFTGSLAAITWYVEKRERGNFFVYTVFFGIIALTSLCKGLIGAVVPLLAVLTDIGLRKSLKLYLCRYLFLALIPAAILYVLPFWVSQYFGGTSYGQSGLYLVYKENILRYFRPFDHKGPIYTYFIYLPIYLLPWTIFLIPAGLALPKTWKERTLNSKWIVWSLLLLFLFFSCSGSRRSYYVLPMLPFGILFISDWILSLTLSTTQRAGVAGMLIISFFLLFIGIDIIPAWYYSQFGIHRFATLLKVEAEKIKPWTEWKIVMLDAESKLNFYLQLPPNTERYDIRVNEVREKQNGLLMKEKWPILINKPANTIFISRKLHEPSLKDFFQNYRMITISTEPSFLSSKKNHDINAPIAFIPIQ